MASGDFVDLHDPDATDAALTGGKAARLARLIQVGLPVPAGFCLTTRLSPGEPATMPPDATAELRRRWECLDAPHGVAVRSSATTEDGVHASAAGQHHTQLGVRTFTELVDAIIRCWQSLWEEPAATYRRHHNIDDRHAHMAVLVQAMVQPTWAGVMFTATGADQPTDDDPMIVEAVPGRSDALVDGTAAPDHFELHRHPPHRLLRHEPAPTDENSTASATLDPATLRVLATHGLQVEQFLGAPQDIEWAVDGTDVHVLQARPITAAVPIRIPEPSWTSPIPGTVWARMSICDAWLPDPLSPLFATTLFPHLVDVWAANWGGPSRARARNPVIPHPMHGTLNGFAYLRLDYPLSEHPLRTAELIFRWLRFHLSPVERRWRREVLPRLTDRLAQVAEEDLPSLSAAAINERIRSVQDLSADYWAIIGGLAWHWNASEWAVTKFLGRQARIAPADLLDGERQANHAEAALKAIADSDAADQQQQLDAYLRRFGHLVYSLDFVEPTPTEDPAALRHAIAAHRHRHDAPQRRPKPTADRHTTRADLPRSPLRRAALKAVLPWARHWAVVRDSALHSFTLGWPYIRAGYLELGRRLVADRLIEAPDDIFFLHADELDVWLRRTLPDDHPGWTDLIARRRADRRHNARLSPPDVVPADATVRLFGADITALALFGVSTARRDGDTLRGSPVSPGSHTGPARVARAVGETVDLQSGEVLIVRNLTPAWAPLLNIAGAVVADVGGALSHGSVVAREYGVPAVMGTKEATESIHTGQIVTVDGDTGIVHIQRDQAHAHG